MSSVEERMAELEREMTELARENTALKLQMNHLSHKVPHNLQPIMNDVMEKQVTTIKELAKVHVCLMSGGTRSKFYELCDHDPRFKLIRSFSRHSSTIIAFFKEGVKTTPMAKAFAYLEELKLKRMEGGSVNHIMRTFGCPKQEAEIIFGLIVRTFSDRITFPSPPVDIIVVGQFFLKGIKKTTTPTKKNF